MIEIIITVYALSYVGMEFVWLYMFKGSLMEEIIQPHNWRGDMDTFYTIFVLLILPASLIAILLVILKEKVIK